MVSLDIIHSSNDRIKSDLPPGLVAVFVGGTNGVGETTVKQFAKYAVKLKAYIVGRSPEAGNRIVEECQTINPEGDFIFLQYETSLMRNVDKLCEDLKSREETVNLLCLTVGTLQVGQETEEGLHYSTALTVYARSRIISNLLPLIRNAKHLRRVVSVFGATMEGSVDLTDFSGEKMSGLKRYGHEASIVTLSLEAYRQTAPEVSFVHNFPGSVQSGIARGNIGPLMRVLKTIFALLGPLVNIPLVEAGDRHLYLCTSARFPASMQDSTAGVELGNGVEIARGTDGKVGSGVYSIDSYGECASPKVEKVLAKLRGEGKVEQIKEKIEADIAGALATRKANN